MSRPRPYWNPYVAGVALGIVLAGSFLLTDEQHPLTGADPGTIEQQVACAGNGVFIHS